MNRILEMDSCRAIRELKGQQPLTEDEYVRLDKMARECPLAGEHFDEVSWVYPLRIPKEPRVRVLNEEEHIISALVILNRNIFVGVIGDQEMEACYLACPGGFIFAVGELEKKVKDDKEFWNLRPRGWKVLAVKKELITGLQKESKAKSGGKK